MNTKRKTTVIFAAFILLFFFAALLAGIILLPAVISTEEKPPLETGIASQATQHTPAADDSTVTRSIEYPGQVYPLLRIRWIEQIDGTLYSGPLKLIHLIYDPAENRTTATYRGTLSPSSATASSGSFRLH